MAGLENEALYKVSHLPCHDLTELWAWVSSTQALPPIPELWPTCLQKVEEDIGSHAKEEIDGFDFMPMKGEMEDNIRKDVQVVKDCAAIPDDLPVHGFIYDVTTGAINQVV